MFIMVTNTMAMLAAMDDYVPYCNIHWSTGNADTWTQRSICLKYCHESRVLGTESHHHHSKLCTGARIDGKTQAIEANDARPIKTCRFTTDYFAVAHSSPL